jgi:hypothetical protein
MGPFFKFNAKSVFLVVNAILRWLYNVTGMYLARFPYFLLVSRVWDISSGIVPFFPLAGGLCKFYANNGGKRPKQRQPLLVLYWQPINPLLSMNNYTPLVISGNDKNKQLTIKPTQTGINRNK